MTRNEKIEFIIDELSFGEHEAISPDIVKMVELKTEDSLNILVSEIRYEKAWLTKLAVVG